MTEHNAKVIINLPPGAGKAQAVADYIQYMGRVKREKRPRNARDSKEMPPGPDPICDAARR